MSVEVRSAPRAATVRQSPFQETEWDVRLDSMFQDLESSAHADLPQQHQQQQFYQRQQHQHQSVSYRSASNSSRQQQHQVQQSQQEQREVHWPPQPDQHQQQQYQQYPLAKSQSEGSLHDSAGAMLKDLDNALKASSNYIETHRTVRGPEGTREFHEVRSFSSGGDRAVTGGGGRADPGDFNLERQVQHMIPVNAASLDRNYSSLQSANMVSSVQQQKTYTTYKVQSNQYSTTGERMVPVDYNDGERPGSRLKQNIDELDTLLSDLNNARGTNGDSGGRHHPTTEYHPHGASSDDYSLSDSGLQGHVKKTVTSFNDYNYQTNSTGQQQPAGDYYSRKPPSPLPGRRRTGGSPGPGAVQPSPSVVRKTSPGPSPSIAITSSSSYNYNLHQSSSTTNGHGPEHYQPTRPDYRSGPDYRAPRSDYPSPGPDYGTSGPSYRSPSPYSPPSDMRRSSPSPSGPRVPSAPRDGTPSGVSYYSKYHSTHTHQSQKSGGPMAFPTHPSPHHGSQTIQSPPKRVDELMSELADFDPSIQPSDIAEPVPSRSRSRHQETTTVTELRDDDHDYPGSRRHHARRSPSPVRPTKQSSTPGPPVYYPPGVLSIL